MKKTYKLKRGELIVDYQHKTETCIITRELLDELVKNSDIPPEYFKLDDVRRTDVDLIIRKLYESQEKENEIINHNSLL